ncbi:uncharacterized GPI-anchored protein At4g28100-like [Typha latifolia]|uniref:uncharacterized GPI-anchored protein At4g28100-like n=1 Tax=Typha latifolia TaxID=4733 RepID=UPI003C2E9A6C
MAQSFLLSFSLLLLLLLSYFSLLSALPVLPHDAAQILPHSSSTTNATTIPAFPEQSDVASSACPLEPADHLLPAVSAACRRSADHKAGQCCPALAAWLHAAYAATSLAARPAPATDLPELPFEDAEACAGGADRALRSRGVVLPRVNGTCDMAFCYCGIRLRRLTCPSPASASGGGSWTPSPAAARRLERDCAKPGIDGCSRCLRTLNQLKDGVGTRHHDCQLMGVTWLLTRNGTRYIPAATSVLRVLMAADGTKSADPTTCHTAGDEMPLAVGSDEIKGQDGSSAVRCTQSAAVHLLFLSLALLSSLAFLS